MHNYKFEGKVVHICKKYKYLNCVLVTPARPHYRSGDSEQTMYSLYYSCRKAPN